jgi:hypothetical protein
MGTKARGSRKKRKKPADFRGLITACLWVIIGILVVGLLIWLMLPAAGRRSVPRKLRGWPQSSHESARVYNYASAMFETSQLKSMPTMKVAQAAAGENGRREPPSTQLYC